MQQPLHISLFKKAAIVTVLLGIITLAFSFALGKQEFFLLLNTGLGHFADYFFICGTALGDGAMWVPALLIVLFVLKRKEVLPLLISAFVLSTIFTQVCKYFVFPSEPRPIRAIANTALIYTVPGVELHTVSSFPSGHTATAFTFYLVFCLLLPGSWWLAVGLFYALWVAYSRIYLAQHFPLDAGAGMLVAFVSVLLSLLIQQWWQTRKTPVK